MIHGRPLMDCDLCEIVEFYGRREDADRELREILGDEPQWVGRYQVVLVDFAGREVELLLVESSAGR